MVSVIYFNQWFSSITPVMSDIKEKHKNSIHIVASSKNPGHAYKNIADKFILEDWNEDAENVSEEYCNWLINTLSENCVDIAFIYRHQDWVAKHMDMIMDKLPKIKIVLDAELLSKLTNKLTMYETISNTMENYVPNYWDLRRSFSEVMSLLRSGKSNLCFKLSEDVGGESFRRITTEEVSGMKLIRQSHAYRMYYRDAIDFFENLEKSDYGKLIFMEYLYGPEISVDCYNSKRGFIAICRSKTAGRVEKIYTDSEIYAICYRLADTYNIKYPFNVQFRSVSEKDNSTKNLRITDINLRLSGGCYLELAAGLNICEVCALDLLGKEHMYNIDDYTKFKERSVTHFETAIEV